MPPKNRMVQCQCKALYDLDEGEKIKALRLYFPMDVLLRQLGAVPSLMHSEEVSG